MEPSDRSGENALQLFSIDHPTSGAGPAIQQRDDVGSFEQACVFVRSANPSETPFVALVSTRVVLNSGFADELLTALSDPGLSKVQWLALVSDGLDLSGRLVQHGNFLDDPATPSPTPLRAAYWADPAVAVIDVARLGGLELDPGTPRTFSELLNVGRTAGLATLVSSRLRFSFGGERSDYLGEWPQRSVAPSSTDNTEWLSTVRPDPSITVAVRTTASRPSLLARNLAALNDAHAVSPASEVLIVSSASANELDAITIEATQGIGDLPLRTVHAPDDGASSRVAAMTTALAAAHSDYVWFVDDDDWATPRALAIIKGAVHATDRPIVVAGSDAYRETWDHETRSESVLERHYHSAEWYRAFTGWNFLPVCSIVMPRELTLDRIAVNPLLRDLGEDYFIQLLLYTAPGSSVAVARETIANISVRAGSDSVVTMEDRTPWLRDLSSYMSDLSSDPNASTAAFWALGRAIRELPYPPEPGSDAAATDATPLPGDVAGGVRQRASRLWKRLWPDAT